MNSYRSCVVRAGLVWLGDDFEEDVGIRVSADGLITHVEKRLEAEPGEKVVELPDEAIMPGFVNTHSHAFHRFLRGRSCIGEDTATTFWKWRDNMYKLVENIDWHTLKKYCSMVFAEMLSAGITTVGEFHYVHHGDDAPFSLDSAVIEAAKETGIRLVLIHTLYQRASFDESPLLPAQRRFVSSFDDFIQSVDKLEACVNDRTTIAVAIHSLRAVDVETSAKLAAWAKDNKKPLHLHLEEQPKELEQCEAALGCLPSDVVLEKLKPGENLTAVHCTFTPQRNVESFAEKGVNISICPCTEGYLGDGVPRIIDSSRICFGTDCNNRISMLEEMRLLAFSQAMRANSRSVAGLTARKLLDAATAAGARSLGLATVTGRFAVGMAFDFCAFSLLTPTFVGCKERRELSDAIVFSADNREIRRVGVAGDVLYERLVI